MTQRVHPCVRGTSLRRVSLTVIYERVCARSCPACEKRHLRYRQGSCVRKSIKRLSSALETWGSRAQRRQRCGVIDRRADCSGWGWFSSLLYRRESAPLGMQHQSESYLKPVLPSLLWRLVEGLEKPVLMFPLSTVTTPIHLAYSALYWTRAAIGCFSTSFESS